MADEGHKKGSQELGPEEIQHRVAVLKRFRELLVRQRDRFHDYLEVLDKQQDVIRSGDADALISHVELEEKIVADIYAIQKVVDPLEDVYRVAYPDKESEVPSLKTALKELQLEVLARSERNRELLSSRMNEIRGEIRTLRGNPFTARRSVYANEGSASLIDLKG
jgi:hypothetical protein